MVWGIRAAGLGLLPLAAFGCTLTQIVGHEDPPASTSADGADDESGTADDGEMRLDVETAECRLPDAVSCDQLDDDPMRALGLNCPGGVQVDGQFSGAPEAITIVHELGTAGTYPAQEGEKFVVLSTGIAAQVLLTPEELMEQPKEDPTSCPTPLNCPSTSLPGFDFAQLPPPLDVHPVHDKDGQLNPGGDAKAMNCEDQPWLVGTGDCSSTLWAQWNEASGCVSPDLPCAVANDYAELRVSMQVPEGVTGVSLDFAFGSVEYPAWWQTPYNDMFVAWLESEAWTGNVSFDDAGQPISLNAGFLDYKDHAPELEGFALEGHAATRWLNTTAGVRPGEDVRLVLAIFDLSDGFIDSYVMLDGVRWTCAGNPPVTKPIP